jgi:phage terminase large subunit-like protein
VMSTDERARGRKPSAPAHARAAAAGVSVALGFPTAADLRAGVTLNPAQAAFLATTARFSFYVGGVGAGKTFAGALRALAYALDHPGSVGLIGAPTYPMLRDATQRTVFDLLDGLRARADAPGPAGPATAGPVAGPVAGEAGGTRGARLPDGGRVATAWEYTYRKVENHLLLPNGSEILFRSLDEPDRVRGLNLAWFWLDEAALCGYYAWQILKGRLRQQGFERQTAGWATGTPHGRDGFARDFELAPQPHHALYRASTLENAAHLPPDYVADLGLSGALYDQEVLGLFTAFEGLVYPFAFEVIEGHAGNVRAPGAEQRFTRVIGGVDWGYTNPTAALVFGLDGDDRAWQLDEFYQRRAPLDATVLPALCALTRRYGVSAWYGGPDEPEHLAALQAALLREGLACHVLPAEHALRPGIQTVLRLLGVRGDGTRGLYVAPRCVATLAEYACYQYPQAAERVDALHPYGTGVAGSGGPPGTRPGPGAGAGATFGIFGTEASEAAEVPIKANDHAMDATRYALHTALGTQARAADVWMALYLRPPARDGAT